MSLRRSGILAACLTLPLLPAALGLLDPTAAGGALLALAVLLAWLLTGRVSSSGLRGHGWLLASLAVSVLSLLPILLQEELSCDGGAVPISPWLPLGALSSRLPLLSAWLLSLLVAAAQPRDRVGALKIGAGVATAASLPAFGAMCGLLSPSFSAGLFAHSNAAVELLVPLLLAIGALQAGQRLGKAWTTPLLLCSFIAGLQGTLAARGSMLLGSLLVGRLAPRRPLLWLAPLVLFFAGDFVGRSGSTVAPAGGKEPVAVSGPSVLPETAQVRQLLWQATASACVENPVGAGAGMFAPLYATFRTEAEHRLSTHGFTTPEEARPWTPHNEFLLAWFEGGWLGLLLLGIGLWRGLRDPARAAWTTPALVAFGFHLLVRSPVSDNPPALAVAAFLWGARASGAAAPTGRPIRFAVLATLAAAPAISQLVGECEVRRWIQNPNDTPIAALDRARAWRPWDARARILTATAVRMPSVEALPDRAQRLAEAVAEAAALDPFDIGMLTTAVATGTGPDRAQELAESLAPYHPTVRHNRMVQWRDAGEQLLERGRRELIEKPREARQLLLYGHLFRALASLRLAEEEPERAEHWKAESAAAFRSSVYYADQRRPQFERILSREEPPDEETLRALLQP